MMCFFWFKEKKKWSKNEFVHASAKVASEVIRQTTDFIYE